MAETDVLVCLIEELLDDKLTEIFDNEGLLLVDLSREMAEAFSPIVGLKIDGRITIAALGLLVVHRFIKNKYSSVIYVDGDTQITGSLSELENMCIPAGKFLAALDYMEISALLWAEIQKIVLILVS